MVDTFCDDVDRITLFLGAGVMDASLVAEVVDGSSNVREVWKLWVK